MPGSARETGRPQARRISAANRRRTGQPPSRHFRGRRDRRPHVVLEDLDVAVVRCQRKQARQNCRAGACRGRPDRRAARRPAARHRRMAGCARGLGRSAPPHRRCWQPAWPVHPHEVFRAAQGSAAPQRRGAHRDVPHEHHDAGRDGRLVGDGFSIRAVRRFVHSTAGPSGARDVRQSHLQRRLARTPRNAARCDGQRKERLRGKLPQLPVQCEPCTSRARRRHWTPRRNVPRAESGAGRQVFDHRAGRRDHGSERKGGGRNRLDVRGGTCSPVCRRRGPGMGRADTIEVPPARQAQALLR
jgi:hypothetical protein